MLLRLARNYGTMISAIRVENWPMKTESVVKHQITELTEILFSECSSIPTVSQTTQILATMKLVTQNSLRRTFVCQLICCSANSGNMMLVGSMIPTMTTCGPKPMWKTRKITTEGKPLPPPRVQIYENRKKNGIWEKKTEYGDFIGPEEVYSTQVSLKLSVSYAYSGGVTDQQVRQ